MKKNFFLLPVFFLFTQCAKAQTYTNLAWQPYPLQVTEVPVGAGQSYLQIACFDSLLGQWKYDSTQVYDNVVYRNGNGILACGNAYDTGTVVIVYDFEKGQFRDTLITTFVPTNKAITHHGLWLTIITEDVLGGVFANSFISYNIVTGFFNFYQHTNTATSFIDTMNEFLISRQYTSPSAISANIGYCGFKHSYTNTTNEVLEFSAWDGVLILWSPSLLTYLVVFVAPDAQGVFGQMNEATTSPSVFSCNSTANGLATYGTDSTTTLGIVDTWLDQWQSYTLSFPTIYAATSSGLAYAERIDTLLNIRTFYSGVYNIQSHSWVVDSVSLDSAAAWSQPFPVNGTFEWYDINMVKQIWGYDSIAGWGHHPTTKRLDFCIKNMQSPSNHNLIFVRDYSIGYDSVLFDFGDGYATNRKASSHLYKTNGHYRMASNNYTVCATAGTQTVCKPVLFSTSTLNIQQPEFNIIVSPNPAHSSINISLSNFSSPVNATLTDITGRFVQQFKITSSSCIYDVTTLRKGIYFLKIDDVVKKVVVQ